MAEEYEGANLMRMTRIRIPYSKLYSKNSIWSQGRKRGHVYIREDVRRQREAIVWMLKDGCKHGQWYEGKIWIDLFVEKPNMRSDAINVLDTICDAVKEAIGVDDRWFSVRRIDWSVVKDDPQIYIGVGQAVEEHHRACSSCGTIKPLASEFGIARHDRLGHGKVCKECANRLSRLKKEF
jgi:Holliday junction resolvase RusA-like endonuclease